MGHPKSGKSRIAAVDGLRAVAVVGVIWAHMWSFGFGAPALPLARVGSWSVDLNRLVSFWGTGVDLFFVISGFCMHLVYSSKQRTLEFGSFRKFVKKRWLRIAPAYYVAMVASAFFLYHLTGAFPWTEVLAHLLFVNGTVPGTNTLAAPFWSLAVEWQFYLLLPVLVVAIHRAGFWKSAIAVILLSIAFRVWAFNQPKEIEDYWARQLPCRLVEFLYGIVVARLYLSDVRPPRLLQNAGGFLLGLGVAYVGRMLMVTEVCGACGRFAPECLAASIPLLGLGFALILWNVISSHSLFQRVLSSAPAVLVGRYSYSLYLWHWIPSILLARWAIEWMGLGNVSLEITFGLFMLLAIPLAGISYRLLEAPYFQRRELSPVPS
jgi:peptidoglycan/LPS O-acetylase OafA/YrhL